MRTLARLATLVSIFLGCAPSPGGGTESASSEATLAGSTATSTGTTASPTTGGGAGLRPCEGSEPILQLGADAPSGFERCASGMIHRVEKVTCEVPQAASNCVDNSDGGACMSNVDCGDPFGQCIQVNGANITCNCVFGCQTDADCTPGQICVCGGVLDGFPATTCLPAKCASDASCADGALCAFSQVPSLGDFTACQTPEDQCDSADDCPNGQTCLFIPDASRWQCAPLPEF